MTFIALDAQPSLTLDAPRRQIAGLAVPYGVPGKTMLGQIRFTQGSLGIPADLSRVKLLISHDPDRPVGFAAAINDTPDGLEAVFRLPPGAAGDAALTEAGDGLRDGLSVGVDLDEASYQQLWSQLFSDDPQPVDARGQLREVSLCSIPVFDDARVTGVAASRKELVMMEPTAAPPAPVTPDPPVLQLADRPAAPPAGADPPTPAGVPMPSRAAGRRDGSVLTLQRMAELVAAVNRRDLEPDILTAALTDITSTTWASPPAYVGQLAGLITIGRPLVNAFGASPLPATGNSYHYPVVGSTPNPDVVAAQKTQIPTGPVTITDASVPIETIAWGNDVSIQTMERSDPAFLAQYFELCAEYYARRCDLIAWADISANSPAVPGIAVQPADLLMQVIAAAEAGGRPVDVIVAALGFKRSVLGSSSANTVPIAVSDAVAGIIEDPNLPAGAVVAGNKTAFTWAENPGAPGRLQAVNVSLLGYDLGIYGYAAHETRYPESVAHGVATATAE